MRVLRTRIDLKFFFAYYPIGALTHRLKVGDNTPMQSNLEAILAGLHENARLIETLEAGDTGGLNAALRRVVDSAVACLPGSAAAVFACGPDGTLELASRITAGTWAAAFQTTAPRANGLGQIALRERRPVIAFENPECILHPAWQEAGAKAGICLPLLVGGEGMGALYVYLHEVVTFQPTELAILGILAQQAASALFQSRQMYAAYRGLARKEDELNRMRHAGLLISSRISLEETLQVILQMALEVTGAHYGILRLIDPSGQILHTRALAGDLISQPLVEALPISGNSVTSWVARSRQPVCIPDLRLEPWNQVYYPLDANLEMRSELAVPLIGASGRLEGVINLESPQVNAFNEDDRLLLQSLATQALVAIQEVRLLDALQEAAQLLLDRPLSEALHRLVELACELLNATAGMAWLREGDHLNLEAAKGPERGRAVLPLYASLTGQAVRTGQPVTSDDLRADPRFHYSELAVEQAWTRALIVPMIAGEGAEAVGALGLYSDERQAAPLGQAEWEQKVLTCLAQYGALAVQNATRQEALKASREQRSAAETFAAMGDIAANLLHHLNNKVGTIPVRIQGIQDKCRPALEADPYLSNNLAEIERSAAEAMETVRLNLSHLQPIHPAPVAIATCVREATQNADLPARVRIETSGLDDLPPVIAGQRTLTLVFVNLLINAAEAMPEGGLIRIEGRLSGQWVETRVIDDGPGILPELHERIFDFNFSARPGKPRGKLGFGLWWVKTLTTRLGGSVEVESKRARGAAFRLRFPRAEGDPS